MNGRRMSHVPTYVYVLLAVLLWMGIARCFPRTIRVERLFIMPILMATLGLRGFLGLFPLPGAADLATALIGVTVGLFIGWHHVRRWNVRIDKPARSVELPGDIMMLVIILVTFGFEFVLHFGVEAHAGWALAEATAPLAAAVWGAFVGMSAGRNLNIAMRYRAAYSILPTANSQSS